ncbi:MAG: dockerin type I repeat-containing protein [Lachnospiraceae bacterium]
MKIKSMIALAMSMCMSVSGFAGIGTVKAEGNIMTEYYISTTGTETATGTKDDPFATLEQAKMAIREINSNMTGDIVVYVEDGLYEFSDTVVFEEADSGTNGYSIRYEAAEGASPRFSGGYRLEGTWTEEGNGIYSIPLDRDDKLRSIYVNDVRANMTTKKLQGRGGYGTYEVTTDMGDWAWAAGSESAGTKLDYDETLFHTRNPEDIELETEMTWNREIVCVDHFEDIGNNQMSAMLQMPYAAIALSLMYGTNYSTSKMQTVYNVYEWLDEPGEFYFDKSGKRLYYYPRENDDMSTAEVIIPEITTLISIEGTSRESRVHHLAFDGITFAYTGWNLIELEGSHGRATIQAEEIAIAYGANHHDSIYRMSDLSPSAFEVSNAEYLSFTDNIFKNLATMGLSLVNDVLHVDIDGNVFMWVGSSGITVGHMQHMYIDDKNSTYGQFSEKEKYDVGVEGSCQYINITNNYMNHVSCIYPGTVPMHIFVGSNMNIMYNYIEDAPYSSLNIGWGWWQMSGESYGSKPAVVPGVPQKETHDNTVKYNTFKNSLQILADGGAIYTLGDMPGSDMSKNFIHGIGDESASASYHIRGIHLDEGTRHLYGEKNVIEIPKKYTCIDCGGDWGAKGYNTWVENYSTSSSYKTTANYEEGTVITNPHTVPDGYWDEDAFAIIQAAGIQSSYYDRMPDEFVVQDHLLPTTFKMDPGTTVTFKYQDDEIDGEVWLAPEGTEVFEESETVLKVVDSKVTIPFIENTYRLYIVKDGVASEPSEGEIILSGKKIPTVMKTINEMSYFTYDVSDIKWEQVQDMAVDCKGTAESTDELVFRVHVIKANTDLDSLDASNYKNAEVFADPDSYAVSDTIQTLPFDTQISLKDLLTLITENVSEDGTITLAFENTSDQNVTLYHSEAEGFQMLKLEIDSNIEKGLIMNMTDYFVSGYHKNHMKIDSVEPLFDRDLSTQTALTRTSADYGYASYLTFDAGEFNQFRFDRFKGRAAIGGSGGMDVYLYGTNDESVLPDNYFTGTFTEAERRSLFSERYDLLTTNNIGKNKSLDEDGIYTSEELCADSAKQYRYLVVVFDSWTTTYMNELYIYGEVISNRLRGDINGDGKVTSVDALVLLQGMADGSISVELGDVDGSTNLTEDDVIEVLNLSVQS